MKRRRRFFATPAATNHHQKLPIQATLETTPDEIKKEIAILSESILAQPQQNLKHVKRLFSFAFDWTPTQEEQIDSVANVKVLCITSLVIIFRDIVPGYPINTQQKQEAKLSAETLRIRRFESQLLDYYVHFVNQLLDRRKATGHSEKALGEKPWLGRWNAAVNQVVLPAHTRALCLLLTDLAHFNEANRIAKTLIKYTSRASKQERRWIEETLMELLGNLHRVSGHTLNTCLSICQYICTFAKWNAASIFCTSLYCIHYAALYSEYQQVAYREKFADINSGDAKKGRGEEDSLIDERNFHRDWRESQGRALDDERRIRFQRVVHSVEQFLLHILQEAIDNPHGNMDCLNEFLELLVKVSIYLSQVSIHQLELYLEKLCSYQLEVDVGTNCRLLNALYRVYFLQKKNRGSKEDSAHLDSLLYQSCGRLLDCRSIHDTDTSKVFGSLLKTSLWWQNPAREPLGRRKATWKRLLWLLLRTESPLLMNIITAIFIRGVPEEWRQVSIDNEEEPPNDSLEALIRESMEKNPNVLSSSSSCLENTFEYFILGLHFHPFVRDHFSSLVRSRTLPLNDCIDEWLSLYTDEMTFIPPVSSSNNKTGKRWKRSFLTSRILEDEENSIDWDKLLSPIMMKKKKTNKTC